MANNSHERPRTVVMCQQMTPSATFSSLSWSTPLWVSISLCEVISTLTLSRLISEIPWCRHDISIHIPSINAYFHLTCLWVLYDVMCLSMRVDMPICVLVEASVLHINFYSSLPEFWERSVIDWPGACWLTRPARWQVGPQDPLISTSLCWEYRHALSPHPASSWLLGIHRHVLPLHPASAWIARILDDPADCAAVLDSLSHFSILISFQCCFALDFQTSWAFFLIFLHHQLFLWHLLSNLPFLHPAKVESEDFHP